MTEIHEVLREDSQQWSSRLPAPADLSAHLDRLHGQPAKHPERRWIVPSLAAAAAVAALAVGLAVTATNSHGPMTHTGTSATDSPTPTTSVASTPQSTAEVPLVVGLSASTAVHRLLHDGFRTLHFDAEVSPLPVGKVLAQFPYAGAIAHTSHSVLVRISAGPTPAGPVITVPGIGTCTFANPPSPLCAGGPISAKVLNGHRHH